MRTRSRVKSILTNKLTKVAPPKVINVVNQETASSEPPKKKRCLFTFMDESQESQGIQSDTADVERELQKYLEEPCEDEKSYPLKYWEEHQSVYPSLAEIAILYWEFLHL